MFIILIIPTLIVMLPQKEKLDPLTVANSTIGPEENVTPPYIEVGVMRSASQKVEHVDLEDYVFSVVSSEMPAEFELEALKAQAVAARTYVIQHLLHNEAAEQIISDTTDHQVYKNEDELKEIWGTDFYWKKEKVQQAVLETEGEILTYESQPITPTFFSMSNGFTENAEHYWGNEIPYLKSVESKWEVEHPNFIEQKVISVAELGEKLGVNLPNHTAIEIAIQRNESERVKEMKINNEKFSGREVREKLGLRSNDFTVSQNKDHVVFTTKGYGHGVGMSQYGADGMAKEGKKYDDILLYFYQNVQIDMIPEVVPTLVVKQ